MFTSLFTLFKQKVVFLEDIKQTKKMASIATVLRLDKINKKGFAPVYFRIIKRRKIRYVNSNIKIESNHWDKKRSKVKSNHPNSNRLNSYLSTLFNELQDKVFEAETDNKGLSTADLKDHIFGKTSPNFLEYADQYIEREYKSKGKYATYDRYRSSLKKLKEHLGKKSLTFDELNVAFLKKYEVFLRVKKGNKTNTIGKEFKSLRRIINEAVNDQIFPFEKSPFHRFKLSWEDTSKVYLEEYELKAFEKFEAPPGSMLAIHKDMFVLACYAGGMRISDLCLLKWISFNGTHLKIKVRKTGKSHSIKLPKVALEILSTYKKEEQSAGDFIFPILKPKDLLNKEKLHKIINSRNVTINKNVRIIAEKVEIAKHISFHTSRHTFATLALSKGMKIHHVSKLLGHASVKTTEVYAKIINKDLDDAMGVFDE